MTNYYYPMYINSGSRTLYEQGAQHCIEDDRDWNTKQLKNEEFTTEEVQAIQTCADRYVDEQNQMIGWFVGGSLVFAVALIVFAWRS